MHSPRVVFSRTGTSSRRREGRSSPLSRSPGAPHEPVHGQGDVPSDPDPAVSDPQDQRRVQPMVELREAVGPGEHDPGESEDQRGDEAGSDQVPSEELAALQEPLTLRTDLAVVLIAAGRATATRGRIRIDRLRLPARGRLPLAKALEDVVDVAV